MPTIQLKQLSWDKDSALYDFQSRLQRGTQFSDDATSGRSVGNLPFVTSNQLQYLKCDYSSNPTNQSIKSFSSTMLQL